jgi:hypothetical protein
MQGPLWITWGGPRITPEESIVVLHAVAKYLREGVRAPKVYFSHPSCEGVLTNNGEGLYGSIGGYIFTVDLGEYEKGKRRFMQCLIPRNEEALFFEDSDPIQFTRIQLAGSKRGKETQHEIRVPKETAIKLHSAN